MTHKSSVPVWDIVVRIFHWSLVLCFIVAYASSEGGGELHEISGYIVLALIMIRVVWGFVGSEYARFSNFLYSPAQVLEYCRSLRAGNPKHYLGHNPLGGWMVIVLLLMLFVVTLSGLKLEDIKEDQSAAASMLMNPVLTVERSGDEEAVYPLKAVDHIDPADEKFWEAFHEIATNIMLALIALHISGVILSSRQHKENLLKAMITGKKEG